MTNTVIIHGAITPPTTGVGVANDMIAKELEKRGERVVIVRRGGFRKKDNITWDGMISFSRIKQVIIEISKLYWKLSLNPRSILYFSVGQSKAGILTDIIKLSYANLLGTPIVLHVHGGRLHETIENLPFLLKKVYLNLLNKCRNIIGLTREQSASLSQLGLKNVITISNGVSDEEAITDIAIKKKLANNSEELKVLYLSNLIPEKGFREVLQASEKFSHTDYNISFKFAGQLTNPKDREWFEAEKKSNNIIQYCGVVRGKEKKKLLEWADIWILPTYFIEEGQPISLLEAMWSGCGIITTHYRGIPEALPEGGAIFVRPKSVEDIEEALIKFYENRAALKKMGYINSLYAKKNYSESSFSNKVIQALGLEGSINT